MMLLHPLSYHRRASACNGARAQMMKLSVPSSYRRRRRRRCKMGSDKLPRLFNLQYFLQVLFFIVRIASYCFASYCFASYCFHLPGVAMHRVAY